MTLAREVFQSTAQRLYAPLTIPTSLRSTLVLGDAKLHVSGADTLSTEDFEKLPQDIRYIHWAKETNGALRVVVTGVPVGWRGDRYDLYLLDTAVAKDDFLNSVNSASGSAAYQPIISDSWTPPLVFQLLNKKTKWFIDLARIFHSPHASSQVGGRRQGKRLKNGDLPNI